MPLISLENIGFVALSAGWRSAGTNWRNENTAGRNSAP
jgi:hypothetical protein